MSLPYRGRLGVKNGGILRLLVAMDGQDRAMMGLRIGLRERGGAMVGGEEEITVATSIDYLAEVYPWWTRESVEALARESGASDEDTMPLYVAAARRKYDECEQYRCVEGCCVVEWHPRLGNAGGAGPAGCRCDRLDDPRGEKIARP
jgi:hypothetical protein